MNVKLRLSTKWENHFNSSICKLQRICGAAVYCIAMYVEIQCQI